MTTQQPLETRSPSKSRIDAYDVLQYLPLLPVVPVVGALVHLSARPRSWSTAKKVALAATGALVGLNLVRWQLSRFTTRKPGYEVVKREGKFEVRKYPSLVVAQTHVDADFDEALNEGFSRLANFIFGKNTSRERVGMTTPVVTQAETLSMTAPVTTQHEGGGYTVSFMMPPDRTLADLPRPDDLRVMVLEQPARTVAALGFRGRYDAEHVHDAERRLLDLTLARGFEVQGEPAFAGYDGPSTLPFLRRNEVWVEISA